MIRYNKLRFVFALTAFISPLGCQEPTPPDEEPVWSYYESPAAGDWFGLDFYDAASVWVVGVRENGSGTAMVFDGVSLKSRTPPVGTSELRDCCVAAENNVWVVGADAAVYRWDGDSFNIWDAPVGELNGVDMGAVDFGFAVGDDGKILSFDGTVWAQTDSPTTADLNSVEFVSPDDAWAVGDGGTVLRYSGGVWTVVAPFTTADLHDTYFITPNDGWLVGSAGAVYHFDGTSWTPADVPRPDVNYYCVAFPATNVGWLGGDKATLLRYDDGSFVQESWLPSGSWELRAIAAPATDNAWAVGPGIILFYR